MSYIPPPFVPRLPRPLPESPRELRFVIDGQPVPAQMGVLLRGGGLATKDKRHARVRSYKDRVRLFTMLAARQVNWSCGPEQDVSVLLRAFLENARVIDCDNIAKAALDAIKGAAFPDDRQVVDLRVVKTIDREKPRLEVEIVKLGTTGA